MEIVVRIKKEELLAFLIEGLDRRGFRVSHEDAVTAMEQVFTGMHLEITAELVPPEVPVHRVSRKEEALTVEEAPHPPQPATAAAPPAPRATPVPNLYGPEDESIDVIGENMKPPERSITEELAEILVESQKLEAEHLAKLKDQSHGAQNVARRPRGAA